VKPAAAFAAAAPAAGMQRLTKGRQSSTSRPLIVAAKAAAAAGAVLAAAPGAVWRVLSKRPWPGGNAVCALALARAGLCRCSERRLSVGIAGFG